MVLMPTSYPGEGSERSLPKVWWDNVVANNPLRLSLARLTPERRSSKGEMYVSYQNKFRVKLKPLYLNNRWTWVLPQMLIRMLVVQVWAHWGHLEVCFLLVNFHCWTPVSCYYRDQQERGQRQELHNVRAFLRHLRTRPQFDSSNDKCESCVLSCVPEKTKDISTLEEAKR